MKFIVVLLARSWVMFFLLIASFLPAQVQAHEFWLVPHDSMTRTNKNVALEARVGPTWPGVQTSRQLNLVSDFQAVDALGSMEVLGRDGSRVIGHLRTRTPGATVVSLRTNNTPLELSGDEFNQYLKEEGLQHILDYRKKNGLLAEASHEQFSRCAKTIILVDGQSQGFDRVAGMPLELVPVTEPLSYKSGDPFTVRFAGLFSPLPRCI